MSVGRWTDGPTSETENYRYAGFAEDEGAEFFGENPVLTVEELPMGQGTKWIIELIQLNGPAEDDLVFQVERELERQPRGSSPTSRATSSPTTASTASSSRRTTSYDSVRVASDPPHQLQHLPRGGVRRLGVAPSVVHNTASQTLRARNSTNTVVYMKGRGGRFADPNRRRYASIVSCSPGQ